ncbi:primosomal protein N' [Candidatus Enterococcus ferrettii]|uniref:Replication restart protein PriA n=1 Tax=Candidatus Enterococcus ferrettii TaxID=2815324 RepID=A0ABV0EIZ5_9ENTE|nr:primosomal protein N' [Enterococcus sp. 665A]MBO1339153.1 primosomal protein N' [Enterococcus sp. 665A]
MKLAQVIVDVPAMQTDQPFTYLIPPQMAVETGMRVEVSFGSRHVQGFVVNIAETSELPADNLKEIIRVLDLTPVLNQELLQLADYMKDTTFAFKITCLQTMLPSVMKANYQKKLYLLSEDNQLKEQVFDRKTEMTWDEAEERGLLKKMAQLREQNLVELRYEVHTKNKVKTERYVKRTFAQKDVESIKSGIRKNSSKQIQLVDYLANLANDQLISVKQMKAEDFTLANLNQAQEKGWLTFEEVEKYRDPFAEREFEQTTALNLNSQQKIAYQAIHDKAESKDHDVFLLEGITGSGKTEVYLQVISDVLEKGQTAMMLVPEISLTPQMATRFKSRFGNEVAVLHSGLSQGEKYDEWRKLERKEARVVVGARSAVFAPLEDLGVIIIDEEHETTYKQEETPRYHARDLAIWRGQYHHCPVVLGSATPSLESRARAQKGVYQLLTLTERANQNAALPPVEIVDMRDEMQRRLSSSFSEKLETKLRDRLVQGEQSVLLLNRRGYSSFVMCRDCGFVLPCPNCDISLTLHMDTKTMRCHYCGHEENIPRRCPNCGKDKIRYYGTGTEKVQEELAQLIPEARVLRMDVDTTRRKGAHEKILNAFGNHEADILLGTQMIAKGLDFANVTLVGVLNADTALNLPDFRSSERTFQLLTQVSGRAGRGEKKGEVLIQTFNPEHYAIQLAKEHDYEGFYRMEMGIRHQTDYPPYYYTVKLTVSHQEEMRAAQKAYQLGEQLKQTLSPQSILLGPTPGAILRVKNRYYYQLIIKYKKEKQLYPTLESILQQSQKEQRNGLLIAIDSEPMYFI